MTAGFTIPRENVERVGPVLVVANDRPSPPRDHGELAARLAELADLKRAGTDTSATVEAIIEAWEASR